MRGLNLVVLLGMFSALIPINAQVVQVDPANPTADDTVEVTFFADKGNKALLNHEGPVYAHSGVIIGSVDEPSGWRYVQGEWGTDDPRMKMKKIGPNSYRFRIHIRSFYGIPKEEAFLQMSFVFRNINGSIVAKEEGEKDIYYPKLTVFEHGPLEKADGSDGMSLQSLSAVQSFRDGSILLQDGKQSVLIQSYGDKTIQFSYFPTGKYSILQSEAVVAPSELIQASYKPYGKNPIDVPWGESYTLRINREPLRFEVRKGQTVLLEDELGFFFDQGDPNIGAMSGLRLKMGRNEHLYGLGSRAISIDRRGSRLYAYNTASYGYTYGEEDLNVSIPFLLSSNGYGLFFDSFRRGYFDLGKTESDILEYGVKDTSFSVFLILDDQPAEIVKEYNRLTGFQPLPPRWALGYIQSRFGYKSQEEVLEITQKTLEAGFPMDACLMDLYWFGGKEKMGSLKWDLNQFPNPGAMISSLAQNGIKTILISETYFVEETPHFDFLSEKGFFSQDGEGESYIIPDFWAGSAALLDVFQKDAMDWFWDQYKAQIPLGVEGWWCDSGEPENHPKRMIHSRGKAEAVHNLYPLYWSKGLYERHQFDFPTQRFFNLARSGYAGMQRYATFPWSGDVSRSWDAFRAQSSIMLGAGLCGLAYMHSDLGGFTGGPKDSELYSRWIQMGTFTPIMRVHGDAEGIEPEPIFYDQNTQQIVKEAIKLRYKLLPYNYTLAYENSVYGLPLARPMHLVYPDQSWFQELDNQYMWGDDFMVVPIQEKGINKQRVLFPPGHWYDFFSDTVYEGDLSHNIKVIPEHIPVFVRAGAFIPMTEGDIQNTDAFDGSAFEIHYYPHPSLSQSSGHLFLDDGQNPGSLDDLRFQLLEFEGLVAKKKLNITIRESQGYAEQADPQQVKLVVHGLKQEPNRVKLNGNFALGVWSEERNCFEMDLNLSESMEIELKGKLFK